MVSNALPVPGVVPRRSWSSHEADLEAELVGQGVADDLLLHLPVEAHEHLLPHIVLAQVDQRVLLGELGQCHMQRSGLGRSVGGDHGLQGRRREMMGGRVPRRGTGRVAEALTDAVADLHAPPGGARRRRPRTPGPCRPPPISDPNERSSG